MRITTFAATCIVLAAVLGVAEARPDGVRDDSFFRIDLSPAGGPVIFLKCEDESVGKNILTWRADELGRCAVPSVWQDTNDLRHLQSTAYSAGGRLYPHDDPLLP